MPGRPAQRVAIGFSVITWRPARGNLNSLQRMQSARCAKNDHVGVTTGEQGGDRGEAARAGGRDRRIECRAIGVADRHQLEALTVCRDGLEMLLSNAPTTDQRNANFASDVWVRKWYS